tara:strand:- start:2810 stop:5320 length:2511 start_codon:yes stop_codon:yes gene_type:complete
MELGNCNYLSLRKKSDKDSAIVGSHHQFPPKEKVKQSNKYSVALKALVVSTAFHIFSVSAQEIPEIKRLAEREVNISLDGFVDERTWESIPAIDGMKRIDPDTLEDAQFKTEIRFFYTERGLYFGIINHQPADTVVRRLTIRDASPFDFVNDGIGVAIDASGEGRYGYVLRMGLGDSMTDGSVLPERQVNLQWDGAWDGRTQVIEEGWSAEFFVPWSMMQLPQSDIERKIGLAFIRDFSDLGERWSSPPLPMTRNVFLSGFRKYALNNVESRRQLTIYPFVSSVFDGIRHQANSRVGADIYWRPTTNTLLSSTLNPDFGTVESDDVVVNLTAFEVFFPERRVFFQEGQEIFNTSPRSLIGLRGGGGPGGPIALLNTRRIGGASRFEVPEGVRVRPTDLSQPTDLFGAAKFTGQSGNLRYGALLASEDDAEIQGTLSDGAKVNLKATGRDFTVGRLLYEDTSGGVRRSFGWMGTDVSHPDVNSTVNAIDAHYFSADQRWALDGQFMHSDVSGITGMGFLGDVSYIPRQGVQHLIKATYIDDEFDMNDVGFLSRNSQMNLDYNFVRTESNIPGIQSRTTTFTSVNQYNTDGSSVLAGQFIGRTWNYLSNETFDLTLQYFPQRVDDRLGRGTGEFRIPERFGVRSSFSSAPANILAWSLDLEASQEDLGPKIITGGVGLVWRPNQRFSFDLGLNYTDQEALLVHQGNGSYTSFEAHQWAPKLESNYFISARQQFRVTLQWNSLKAFEDRFWQVNPDRLERLKAVANPDNDPDNFVISRLTFQARYRWQIAPLSDLFIVYTRGSNLPGNSFFTFQDLLEQGWNDKIVDSFAIKLRYRFDV